MRKLQYIPITCLRGPHFLVMWNIHVSCNLPCATHGIAMLGVAMCVTTMQGTCLGNIFNNTLLQEYNKTILLLTLIDKHGITLIL